MTQDVHLFCFCESLHNAGVGNDDGAANEKCMLFMNVHDDEHDVVVDDHDDGENGDDADDDTDDGDDDDDKYDYAFDNVDDNADADG